MFMAKGGLPKAPNARLDTKWINNALRSIGSIAKTSFSDDEMAPNFMTTVDNASEVMRSVREFTKGNFASNVNKSINNNKYVKVLGTAYKNALNDIKSGNLNNTDRMMDSLGDSDDSFSVGTEDESGNSSLTVNLPDSSEGYATLSRQVQRNTEAQLKMAKASMDASIAVSAASMVQFEKIGSEINLHLTNIENSVGALVQFNMSNMQKFIESSIAYYERVGSTIESEYGKKQSRLSAADIYSSNTGGLNLQKYRQYVMQQFKDTELGMMVGTLADENMLKMLAANPVGTAANMAVQAMMPKIIKSTVQQFDQAYSAFSVSFLEKLGRLSERTGDTIMDNLLRTVGQTFGLRSERTSKMDSSAMVKKEATPFDGITRHSITEIIPKELREQTAYLKIIASHYDKKASDSVEGNARVFDYMNGKYTTTKSIDKALADSITEAISNAFNSGSFGKSMRNAYTNATDANVKDEDMDRIMREFYSKLERSTSRFSTSEFTNASATAKGGGELNSILRSLGSGSKRDKKAVESLVKALREMDGDNVAINDFFRARFLANKSRNDAIKKIRENPYETNYFSSSIFNQYDKDGEPLKIDEILDKYYGYKAPDNKITIRSDDINTLIENAGKEKGKSRLAANAKGNILEGTKAFLKLDYEGMFSSIGKLFGDGAIDLFNAFDKNLITPIKNTFFGSKRADGYSEGGIFSGTRNTLIDIKKSVVSSFTGKEWKDSNGKVHKIDKPEETVMGSLRSMRDKVVEGLRYTITGKKEPDKKTNEENGENEKKPTTIFGMVKNIFQKGFDGWSQALFGKSTDDIIDQKDAIIDKFSKMLPSGLMGGAIGGAVGAASTGSLLGWFVGGPIGGALIGMATGFATKSDRFQEWFFGKSHLDENGNKIIDQRGLIPESLQNFLKENKVGLALGGTAGAVTGIGSSGFLGYLVGGPIAGALVGMGASIVAKSNMFHEFLYGDEKTGQRGILTSIGSVFSKFKRNSDGTNEDGAQILGMGIIGAASGAAIASVVGKMGVLGAALTPFGPIGGAVLGLGASILAQKDKFHEWLFGKKNEKGEKIKEGVFGQFANMIKANVINPFANTFADIADDLRVTFKYDVLDTIRYAFEPMSELLFGDPNDPEKNGVIGSVIKKVDDMVEAGREKLVNVIGTVAKTVLSPVTKIATTAIRLATKTMLSVATAPFKLLNKATSVLTNKMVTGGAKILKYTTDAVKNIFSPFAAAGKFLLGGIFNGVRGAATGLSGIAQYGINKVRGKNSFLDAVLPESVEFEGDPNSFSDRWKARKEQKKLDLLKNKQNRAIRKQRSANEKFISKWTNGQFVIDNEEGRAAAIAAYNAKHPNQQILSEEQIKNTFGIEALDQKENAKMTGVGVGENGLYAVKDLPWEGKIYKSVQDIYDKMVEIFDPNHQKREGQTDEEGNPTETADANDNRTSRFLNDLTNDGGPRRSAADVARDIANAGGILPYLKGRAFDASNGIGTAMDNLAENILNTGTNAAAKAKNIGSKLAKFLRIPGYATGTSHAQGFYVTGENGPEIAYTGPNSNTSIAPNGGGLPVFITGMSGFVQDMLSGQTSEERARNAAVAAYKKRMGASAANDDNVTDDGNLGNTADEIQNRKEDAEKDKAQMDAMLATAENTEETAEATTAQHNEWKHTFGADGIITTAVVGLGLLVTNWIRKNGGVFETLKTVLGGVQNAVQSLGDGLGSAFNQGKFRAGNDTSTNGDNVVDLAKGQLDRFAGSAASLSVDNFVMGKDGKWDHQSAANAKMIGTAAGVGLENAYKFAVSPTGRAIGKVASYASKGISKAGIAAGKAGANIASKVVGGVRTAVKTAATDAALNMNPKSIITKALTFLDDGIETTIKAINKTLGTKLTSGALGKVLNWVKETIGSKPGWVANKLSFIMSKEGAKTVVKAIPLINIAFIGISALNGLSGAARLFKVSEDNVDLKMRAISAGFAALTATLPGTVIDVLNEVISELTGIDLLQSLALTIYNFLSSEEDKEKLKTSQADFQNKYLEYQQGEIDKSYEKAIKDGTIDPSVTKEQYTAGVKNGTYEASYMSFEDYNSKVNKSVGEKIASGVATVGSTLWRGGKAVVSGAGTVLMDGAKATLAAPIKGVQNLATFGGDFINLAISALTGNGEALTAKLAEIGSRVTNTPKIIKETFDTSRESMKTGEGPKIAFDKYTKGNPIFFIESIGNFVASIAGTAVGSFEYLGNMLTEPFKKIGSAASDFFGGIADFFTGGNKDKKNETEKVEGGRGSKQNGFPYYSQNDPRWANKRYTESGGRDANATIGNSGCGPAAMSMIAAGMTGRDIDPTAMARFAQRTGNRDKTGTNWRFIDDSSKALGISSTRAMNPSSEYIANQLRNGHPMILSGRSIGGRGAFTKDGHYVVAVGTDRNGNVLINDPRGKGFSGAYNLNDVASETGAAWSFGGRGDATIQNGAYYYSQNDSQWGGQTLTGFNSSVKHSGCVMTSAAMGVSSILGTPIDPGTFNSTYGNGNVGTTRWGDLGISCQRYPANGSQGNVTTVPAEQIISALKAGKPVMLLGQKEVGNIYYDGGSTGKGTSHCVLATGLDANGNIIVNDPWSNANATKKSQSFRIDQLNPFYWAQVLSGSNGSGIQSNLKSTGMASSYTTTAPINATNNHSYDNIAFTTTDIKQLPKLTESDVTNILLNNWANHSGSIFTQDNAANSAKGIVKAQNETGVSALVPLSIGALESGWGTSNIAKKKGNLWGWAAYNSDPLGSATSFGTNQYGAFRDYTNNLVRTYYDGYGAKTIYQIGTGENPAGKGYAYNNNGTINKKWPDSVNSCGSSMIKTLNGSTASMIGASTSGSNISATGSTVPSEGEDKSQDVLGTLTNFFSEFGTRALNGVLTGKFDSDYSSVFNSQSETTTDPSLVGGEASGGRGAAVAKQKYPLYNTSHTRKPRVGARAMPTSPINVGGGFGSTGSIGNARSIEDITQNNDTLMGYFMNMTRGITDIAANTSRTVDLLESINRSSGNTSMSNTNNVNINAGGNGTTVGAVSSSPSVSKRTLAANRNGELANRIAKSG